MRRLLAFATLLVAPSAMADTPPSIWERTRDPAAAEAFVIHRAVHQRLVRTTVPEIDLGERERVLAMLERVGAEKSKNPLLRFDLAEVYFQLGNHGRAAQIFKSALADFPDHPLAEEGWMRLALACGHIGDHACESQSYIEVLRLETEDVRRITPTLNFAETRMHLGDLTSAIADYREVLRLSGHVPARETVPLAAYGLAVALDRSGDTVGAEREMGFAIELEHSMGLTNLLRDTNTVFFVPDYEIHWYEGLKAAAIARVGTKAAARAAWWRAAEKSYGDWVRAAERQNDRWLPIAKVRLAQAKVERERAAKAAELEPKTPATKDLDL